MIAFGPVPSRRLGHSLGVNNIPPKHCSYACIYCQLGRTSQMQVARRNFYGVETVRQAVATKVTEVRRSGVALDYLTFVPDGEPTLDVDLGREIKALKAFGVPIAVITNSSLIWREDVRQDLLEADWVSLKVDTVREDVWRRLDRPHGALCLTSILEGALAFARAFSGTLVTETMLVRNVNERPEVVEDLAAFLEQLAPSVAYLGIPTRPPAESWVEPPTEAGFNRAFQLVAHAVPQVEALIGYEGNAFASTGDVTEDLLSITAVHPMREDAVRAMLADARVDWAVVERLITAGQLTETSHDGHRFYVRRFARRP